MERMKSLGITFMQLSSILAWPRPRRDKGEYEYDYMKLENFGWGPREGQDNSQKGYVNWIVTGVRSYNKTIKALDW